MVDESVAGKSQGRSRRKTPWDGGTELTPTQEFLQAHYLEPELFIAREAGEEIAIQTQTNTVNMVHSSNREQNGPPKPNTAFAQRMNLSTCGQGSVHKESQGNVSLLNCQGMIWQLNWKRH